MSSGSTECYVSFLILKKQQRNLISWQYFEIRRPFLPCDTKAKATLNSGVARIKWCVDSGLVLAISRYRSQDSSRFIIFFFFGRCISVSLQSLSSNFCKRLFDILSSVNLLPSSKELFSRHQTEYGTNIFRTIFSGTSPREPVTSYSGLTSRSIAFSIQT